MGYRFGTSLTSEDINWSSAQKTMNGRRPHTVDKFWVQSPDPHSCVVGFDDPSLLPEYQNAELHRAEIWTLWIFFGVMSLVSLGCSIFMLFHGENDEYTDDGHARNISHERSIS